MSRRTQKRCSGLQDCARGWKRIMETARELKFEETLRHPQSARLKNAVALLGKTGLPDKPKKQQIFLDRVLEISPVYFLLCAIALSQNQVAHTKSAILDNLIETMVANKDNNEILRPSFRLYAIKFGVPGAAKLFGEHAMPAMLQEANQRDRTLEEAAVSDELAVVDKSREPNFAAGRAVAAFENAMYLAAHCIPETERQAWLSPCLDNLRLLKQLTCMNEGDIRPRDSLAKPSGMKVALMSVMAQLESILGRYLFEGMKASRMRRHEEDMGRITFTDAVRLRLAYQLGEDFLLEVWLDSRIGNAISQVRSVEGLRDMLGDYLFTAMEASNRRKEEKRKGMRTCTNAVNLSSPSAEDSDEDSKLEIMLSFEMGRKVHEEAYPS